jgi:hypothetical protein
VGVSSWADSGPAKAIKRRKRDENRANVRAIFRQTQRFDKGRHLSWAESWDHHPIAPKARWTRTILR